MDRLAIIGAGMFGRQALEIAHLQKKYDVVGFYDDFSKDDIFEELPILGKIDDVRNDFSKGVFDVLFIAIGYNHLEFKQNLFKKFASIPFATIIHPTAIIEKSAVLEGGEFNLCRSLCGTALYIAIWKCFKHYELPCTRHHVRSLFIHVSRYQRWRKDQHWPTLFYWVEFYYH